MVKLMIGAVHVMLSSPILQGPFHFRRKTIRSQLVQTAQHQPYPNHFRGPMCDVYMSNCVPI